ncbi:hypothetical protein [Neisseria sp. Ec49-e6-T10]|uniref:hypothetical protein n=1 Tax=Neisseria sp. Ec49-e6-T10 TaxID=3140744 RepID=UPI003EBCCAD1
MPSEKKVPYFAQFESRTLIQAFISGQMSAVDDPLWYLSGAHDQAEYAKWCVHVCGMACLKMHLSFTRSIEIPTLNLARSCTQFGGYALEGEAIHGLIYRPFLQFVQHAFKMDAQVIEHTPIEHICARFQEKTTAFIASVHPSIRSVTSIPEVKGGHLVYVFDFDERTNEVLFHNPSGTTVQSQENVRLKMEQFAQFYSGRGILLP